MKEDPFVKIALAAAKQVIGPPLLIKQGAALLYQVNVDNKLEVKINPKEPKRGYSAFQTDLCIFEEIDKNTKIPRVVLEFKKGLSTHDVLVYSAKARKHKQIYPYLRYGMIIGKENKVPGRFLTHNEALDFCVAAASFKKNRLHELLAKIIKAEIKSSRQLEEIVFGNEALYVYRNEVIVERGDGRVV
jgi:hypothetical protein